MPVGQAIPDKDEQKPAPVVVEKEAEAKSADESRAQDEVTPTGEEIHAAAREIDAKNVKGKKATGKEVVQKAADWKNETDEK